MAFLLRPLLFLLDPERAHRASVAAMRVWGSLARSGSDAGTDDILATRVAGVAFSNPIGLAAGLDKDAEAFNGFLALGFGAVEVGTITPLPQAGNPRPRLFRLTEDAAVINRMGFNNKGLDAALARIAAAKRRAGVLGINVGANKDSADRIADYTKGVAAAAPLADYVTINISSPNTPGLRDLQRGAALAELLAAADKARQGERRVPLFLKVAPDLEDADIADIAAQSETHRVDALIVANTTISRPPLAARDKSETGGLSGAPLAPLARQRLKDFRAATGGRVPLISAGGIDSADEAWARIRAGASLVQLYSAMVYEGPGLPRRIVAGLAERTRREGFANIAEAIGTG